MGKLFFLILAVLVIIVGVGLITNRQSPDIVDEQLESKLSELSNEELTTIITQAEQTGPFAGQATRVRGVSTSVRAAGVAAKTVMNNRRTFVAKRSSYAPQLMQVSEELSRAKSGSSEHGQATSRRDTILSLAWAVIDSQESERYANLVVDEPVLLACNQLQAELESRLDTTYQTTINGLPGSCYGDDIIANQLLLKYCQEIVQSTSESSNMPGWDYIVRIAAQASCLDEKKLATLTQTIADIDRDVIKPQLETTVSGSHPFYLRVMFPAFLMLHDADKHRGEHAGIYKLFNNNKNQLTSIINEKGWAMQKVVFYDREKEQGDKVVGMEFCTPDKTNDCADPKILLNSLDGKTMQRGDCPLGSMVAQGAQTLDEQDNQKGYVCPSVQCGGGENDRRQGAAALPGQVQQGANARRSVRSAVPNAVADAAQQADSPRTASGQSAGTIAHQFSDQWTQMTDRDALIAGQFCRNSQLGGGARGGFANKFANECQSEGINRALASSQRGRQGNWMQCSDHISGRDQEYGRGAEQERTMAAVSGGPAGRNCLSVGEESEVRTGDWNRAQRGGTTIYTRTTVIRRYESIGVDNSGHTKAGRLTSATEITEEKRFNGAGAYEGGSKTTSTENAEGIQTDGQSISYRADGNMQRASEGEIKDKDKKQDKKEPKEETEAEKKAREKKEKAEAAKKKASSSSMCADPSSCSDSCTGMNQQALAAAENCQIQAGAADISGAVGRPKPGEVPQFGRGPVDPSGEDADVHMTAAQHMARSGSCMASSSVNSECGLVMCGEAASGAIAGHAVAAGPRSPMGAGTCCGVSIRGLVMSFQQNACIRSQCGEGEQCQCTAQTNKGGGRAPPSGDTVGWVGGERTGGGGVGGDGLTGGVDRGGREPRGPGNTGGK